MHNQTNQFKRKFERDKNLRIINYYYGKLKQAHDQAQTECKESNNETKTKRMKQPNKKRKWKITSMWQKNKCLQVTKLKVFYESIIKVKSQSIFVDSKAHGV